MFQNLPISSKLFTVYCFSSFLCSVHFLPQVTYFFLIFMLFFDSDLMSGLLECCRDIECANIFGEFRNIGNGFNFFHNTCILYFIIYWQCIYFLINSASRKFGSFLVVSIASSIFFFSGWWIVIDAAVRCNISDVPAAQMQEIDQQLLILINIYT